MKFLSHIGGYALNTALTFAVGIASVPLLIMLAGQSTWAGLAVTQSVAGVAAVLVGLGWNAMGPTQIAALEPRLRPDAYWRSLLVRVTLFILVGPLSAVCGALLTGIDPAVASIATLAYLVQSLGASWYFVGQGRAYRLLWADTFPRLASIGVGLAILAATGSVLWYSIILLAGTLTAATVGNAIALRDPHDPLTRPSVLMMLAEARRQKHAFTTTSSAAIYANTPLIAVSLVAPQALEPFALAFKLYNYAAAAFLPIVQFLQGWVPAGGSNELPSRVMRALRGAALSAAIAAILMGVGMPLMGVALSAGEVHLSYGLAIAFGAAIGCLLLNQVGGLACLPALGRTGAVARSVTVGAAIGIVMLFLGPALLGASGAALGVAATEASVATYQQFVLRAELRGRRASET